MRTVDLIQRKRDGEELSPEEISFLVERLHQRPDSRLPDVGVSHGRVFRGHDGPRGGSALTDCMLRSGETVDLSVIPGIKVDKHSTGGVGDKTSLIARPAGCIRRRGRPDDFGPRAGAHGRHSRQTRVDSRVSDRPDHRRIPHATCEAAIWLHRPDRRRSRRLTGRFTRCAMPPATVESIPLIASSIMSKKLAAGLDALVLDVKVGAGAFMKKQVDARRLAQMMVGIGRRMGTSACRRSSPT